MAINKTLELSFNGEDYSLIITMKVIDYIESKDINLMKMFDQFNQGDVRFSHVAKLIAILLNAAGAKVTQQEVWEGMFSDGDLQAADCVPLMQQIFASIFPDVKKKSTGGKKVKKKRKA